MLTDLPDDFRYILALQEGAAIGMADGFAQATGRPALVNLHAAAGMGNAMGNLTNTQKGHVPVIVTSGQQARKYTELKAYLTNVDAPKLAEPLVKWSHEPPRPQDTPQSLSKAILLAAAAPTGPVYLSLPLDDWDQDADASALGFLKSRVTDGNPVRLRRGAGEAARPAGRRPEPGPGGRAGHRHSGRMGRRGAAGREAVAAGADSAQPAPVPVPHPPPQLSGHPPRRHPRSCQPPRRARPHRRLRRPDIHLPRVR